MSYDEQKVTIPEELAGLYERWKSKVGDETLTGPAEDSRREAFLEFVEKVPTQLPTLSLEAYGEGDGGCKHFYLGRETGFILKVETVGDEPVFNMTSSRLDPDDVKAMVKYLHDILYNGVELAVPDDE